MVGMRQKTKVLKEMGRANGDGKKGEGSTEGSHPRSQLPTFTTAPTVAKRSNNRKFGMGIGHKNMEALHKLQKNQSESLPVHSEANVFPYPTVNPEKLKYCENLRNFLYENL